MKSENIDTLLPAEMALQAEHIGVLKVNMSFFKTLVLSILAGAFIAFGSVFYTSVTAEPIVSYGLTRLIGGLCFSLGLILVVIGGAELFTGNNLIIMAWANKKVSIQQVMRNWLLVFFGNMIGSFFVVLLVLFSRQYLFGSGAVGLNMLKIAKVKCELDFFQAVSLGVLCNILVCLAVWLSFSSRSVSGKVWCIIFPITAFVVGGFEHSVANMYFIPNAILLLNYGHPDFIALANSSGQGFEMVTWTNFFFRNLLPVTIGNIIGGAFLVGIVYWFVFLRKNDPK